MAGRKKQDEGINYDEDLDPIDFNNYKGMFFNDDPGQKFQDEVTGAHFEHNDMCKRLKRLQQELQQFTQTIESDEEESPSSERVKGKSEEKQIITGSNGQAFQVLHDLLSNNKPKVKESRNAAQALPQQGYGTTGAFGNNQKMGYVEPKNFRQFSSQLGPQPDTQLNIFKKGFPIYIKGSNRSKSTDKQRSCIVQKDHPTIPGVKIQPHQKTNVNPAHNVKRKTFLDLYINKLFL